MMIPTHKKPLCPDDDDDIMMIATSFVAIMHHPQDAYNNCDNDNGDDQPCCIGYGEYSVYYYDYYNDNESYTSVSSYEDYFVVQHTINNYWHAWKWIIKMDKNEYVTPYNDETIMINSWP